MLSRASSNTTMPLSSGTAPARRSERPRALAVRAHTLRPAQYPVGAHRLRSSCGGHGRRIQTTPRLHCGRRTHAHVTSVSRARGGEVGARREESAPVGLHHRFAFRCYGEHKAPLPLVVIFLWHFRAPRRRRGGWWSAVLVSEALEGCSVSCSSLAA